MASEASQAGVDMVEPVGRPSVSRFLKNRTAKQADSDYHPTHKESALADLPDFIEDSSNVDHDDTMEEDDDRDFIEIPQPESRVSEREIRRLKQETSHLPFDTVLKVLAHYHFNVPIAIAAAQQMSTPDLMGPGSRRIFTANVAYEREKNPTRLLSAKQFYLADELRNQCDTKALVDFYYSQKNRIDTNWRLERCDDEGPMTSEERAELQEKMIAGGVRYCRRGHYQIGPYKSRNKRSLTTRRLQNLRRGESQSQQQPGCSKDRDVDVDSSDSVSVASSCPSLIDDVPTGAEKSEKNPSEDVLKLKIQPHEIPMGESAASPAGTTSARDSGIATSSEKAPEAVVTAPKVSEASEAPVASKIPESLMSTAPVAPNALESSATTSPSKIPKVRTPKSAPTSPPKQRKVVAPEARAPESKLPKITVVMPSPSECSSSTTIQMPKLRFNVDVADLLGTSRHHDDPISPPTSSSSSSGGSTSTTPVKVTSSSGERGGVKIKKTYKKKTLEQLRNGPPKTYPDRERRPRKIFE